MTGPEALHPGKQERIDIMLKQISLYAENKKGTLESITDILLKENINILGSMTDDGAEYGVNRMVVSDPKAASESLQKAGYLCSVKNVIGVEVSDQVGNLHALLKTLLDMNVNVHYLYLSFNRESGLPIMVFSTDDIWEVEDGLKNRGYQVV